MNSGDGQLNICPKELMELFRGSAEGLVTWHWAQVFHICRPAIEELNSENLAWVCLITGFWHFQSMGWPLLKFGFLSCRSGWDFWCDWSVCMWLTEGRGFWGMQSLMNTLKLFLQQVSILSDFGNGRA